MSHDRGGDRPTNDGAWEARLLDVWRGEYGRPVEGWDLGELDERLTSDEPPWSYESLAREALAGGLSVLDMGTGGGEVLLGLTDALPADTVATEGWAPNLPVATRNLRSLGIPVLPYDAEKDATLPFPVSRFDRVLNRHEAYDAAEVVRVLVPGGRFLTQQVDGRDFEEIHAIFGSTTAYPHINLEQCAVDAERAGLTVEASEEWRGSTRFADVAALVRYLRWVPWEGPADFSVDRYSAELLDLHHTQDPLAFTQRRFYLDCRA